MISEKFCIISRNHLDSQETSFGFDDFFSRYENMVVNKYFLSLAFVKVVAHIKCLSSGTGLIKKRCVAYLQLSEFLNHGLIVDERLQSALRHLSLVRSISCVPAWVFEEVSLNNRWC